MNIYAIIFRKLHRYTLIAITYHKSVTKIGTIVKLSAHKATMLADGVCEHQQATKCECGEPES